MTILISALAAPLLLGSHVANAIQLDLTSPDSIKQAAATVAYGMVKYYTGNNTGDVPGNLPAPYYWWEAGAMFGSLVNYWYFTGDTSYNAITTQALLFQTGPNNDYMPPNQTKTEGNDDQAFWGMSAMTAAEVNYPNPPSDQPQWLALAQAVFNTQAVRWDESTCNGGLRWQIFTFNNGYNYKNTISNGCFFNMASRLARYTGNQTYADWAERMWDWVSAVGLMSTDYHFFDGTDDRLNCSSVNHIQWTYNAGIFLHGAAIMWNMVRTISAKPCSDPMKLTLEQTQTDVWKQRVDGIIAGLPVFFNNSVMFEVACETINKCDVDQRSFKAYLTRDMAQAVKVAPWTAQTLMPMLQASAMGAAGQCSGNAGPYGALGNVCGMKWTQSAYDGTYGVGEQMAALEVIQSNLISQMAGPLTGISGGTSAGDPAAGGGGSASVITLNTITIADKAGASIITAFVLGAIFSGTYWVIV